MLVDIIIPSFNRASCLKRAIESVLKQKYRNYNLFVVDDGSTDETHQLMTRYSNHSNVHYLRQDNKGVSAARNLGIRSSSAPWIAFLDSDDEWLDHKLSTQVDFISKNPALRFVHSNEIWIRHGARVNPKKKFDKSNHEIFRRSLEMCLISPSTVMIKRELSEEHDHFDENFVICEDYDLWLKILSTEEVGFIPDYLINKYGGHEDQLSTKFPAMDYWRIRSMINLYSQKTLDEEKKKLIIDEISKKAPILLQGYLKHQNHEQHKKLTEMISKLLVL